MRPEVERRVPFWYWVGTACGGGLGFIIANVPGMMLGALAGNRLGAVRDAKGKPVAAVFSELTGSQRAEVNTVTASPLHNVLTEWTSDSSCSSLESLGLRDVGCF